MIERRTRQLEAVLEAVNRKRDHPTALEVYSRVRRLLPRISRGTVYRNLGKLQQQRRLRVVRLAGRPARYDSVVEQHDHFVCDACGVVSDLAPRDGNRNAPKELAGSGYLVQRQSVSYYGLCPHCAVAKKE